MFNISERFIGLLINTEKKSRKTPLHIITPDFKKTISLTININLYSRHQSNRAAVFDASHIEPTISKTLSRESIEHDDERRYSKIKPAKSQQNTTIFYDELVE